MIHGCNHAVEQARLRYGMQLDEMDFVAMVSDILATLVGEGCEALLIAWQPPHREVWAVRIPGGPLVRVVYETQLARILTVLPPEYRLRRPFESMS